MAGNCTNMAMTSWVFGNFGDEGAVPIPFTTERHAADFVIASTTLLLQNAQGGLSYGGLAFPRIPEQVDLTVGPLNLLHHLGRLFG
jgi:hypothetical protein